MNEKVMSKASKIKKNKKKVKIIKLILLILLLLLLAVYIVVGIIYNSGNFSITLDKNLYLERGIIIYDDPNYKVFRAELFAETVDTFDNISYKWLPDDLDKYDGSHNGDNYVAYTFYIENLGKDVSDYYAEIIVDDVIKKVDEAVRIRVYRDGEYTTYAKLSHNGQPEKETTPFKSNDLIALEHVENFGPGDKKKYTVVIWLEGSDPDCTNNIIGGEIKIHMNFNSEFVEK